MSRKLKIALLVPSISSAKAFFIPLLSAGSKNIQFHLVTSPRAAFDEEGNIPSNVQVHFVPDFRTVNPLKLLRSRIAIKKVLKKLNADIVHAHFISAVFLLASIPVKAQKWITLHGVYYLLDSTLKGKVAGLLERYAIKNVDRVEVLNSYDYDSLQHRENVHRLPIPGVGVNREKFNPQKFGAEKVSELRSELNLKDNDLVLLYVGRYTSFKGYYTVIEAARRFSAIPRLKIITCGSADTLHPAKEKEYLPSNIIDVGWSNEVEKYMAIADLLLFPSHREGLPVTLMEALTMNLPILGYKVRGVEDLIKEQQNGFLTDEVSQYSFLRYLEELINHHEKIVAMKRKLLSQNVNYSSEIYVQQQLSTYLSKS